ncbi:Winged helix DNA-binding domain-containing protein [Friedmanniella luteola]|uniref:Winged helix DNA-binding domain-containing protein n=1 Tax=Friedmanniella luteola TaxID=546871 RepID=A0A1H1R1P5_9ACTN|nr:winged helix DNA-binding domain-containing protein [Friedmanniella luteola]SDS28879.1 Winged helix DNA-binding domain-containing protein [Friedmanniella luteola]
MRLITSEERRARLAARHRLLPRLRDDDLPGLVDDLVGLHSSDPVTVYLSAAARMRTPSIEAVAAALYEDRSLVRHHAMRRTLWVATPEMIRLMHAAATRLLVAPERRRTLAMLAASGVADPEDWLAGARNLVLDDLETHGPSTARDVGRRVPALTRPLTVPSASQQQATQAAHTRVLLNLGFTGEVLRAAPTGTWVNGAYRYGVASAWLPGGLGEQAAEPAAAALAGAYLRRFGPVTAVDLQWWTGWTKTTTSRALAACGAVPVELDEGRGWVAAGDEASPAPEPWVAALPSLDPTTMGWKERDWYLPAAGADAFDANGNAGPTLWVDGRVVGAWAQTKDGRLVTHYFEPVPAARREELAERLTGLAAVVDGTRFTVRFPGRIQPRLLAAAT